MEKEFYIITPCYNDFESLYILLENIDRENEKYKYSFSVIIVNDASLQDNPFVDKKFENIKTNFPDRFNKKRRASKSYCFRAFTFKFKFERT